MGCNPVRILAEVDIGGVDTFAEWVPVRPGVDTGAGTGCRGDVTAGEIGWFGSAGGTEWVPPLIGEAETFGLVA